MNKPPFYIFILRNYFQEKINYSIPSDIISEIINKSYDDISIGTGYQHCYILKNFKLYVCGKNQHGQLGLGDNINRNNFCLVNNIPEIKKVAFGDYYSVLLTTKGEVYTTGCNNEGQLGLNDDNNRNLFCKINLSGITDIMSGGMMTIALNKQGEVFVWGLDLRGRTIIIPGGERNIIHKLTVKNVKNVYCGAEHIIMMMENGKLYGLGSNVHGQLGLQDDIFPVGLQEIILNDIIQISCGHSHSVVLTKSNKILGSGSNNEGQLGIGQSRNRTFRDLSVPYSRNSPNIICGTRVTFIITNDLIFPLTNDYNIRQMTLYINKINDAIKINNIWNINITCGRCYFLAVDKYGKIYISSNLIDHIGPNYQSYGDWSDFEEIII